MESTRVDSYVIDELGGNLDNRILFTCRAPSQITTALRDADFTDIEIFRVPSEVYDNMPRLKERGVSGYHVRATVDRS